MDVVVLEELAVEDVVFVPVLIAFFMVSMACCKFLAAFSKSLAVLSGRDSVASAVLIAFFSSSASLEWMKGLLFSNCAVSPSKMETAFNCSLAVVIVFFKFSCNEDTCMGIIFNSVAGILSPGAIAIRYHSL